MNPQERQVIDGIFDRLKNVATQPRDPEAEQYIGELVHKQPYATYALAQSVYVQEQALLGQQQQIEQLQAEIEQMRARPAPAASGGGFLSGLFGGGQAAPASPAQNMPAYGQRREAPAPGPWGGQPQRQGMGFLATAGAAAAGVAGGMVLGSILSSALGGGAAQAATPEAQNLFGGENAQDTAGADDMMGHHEAQEAGWDDPGFGGDSFEA